MTEEKNGEEVAAATQRILDEEGIALTKEERQRLLQDIRDEVFGLGPIEPLLRDPTVCDILVNGPHQVYVERAGKMQPTAIRFSDDAHVLRIIERIVSRVGRRIDESNPMVDARLADGSRVNAIIPPLALDGPSVSIRRFATDKLDHNDLIRFGSMTPELVLTLQAAVARAPQRADLGRHRLGQDDAAQRALELHPGGRAHHHDRGLGRAPAAAEARGPARDAAREPRGQGRDHPARAGGEHAPHAARPHRRRRVPCRGGARHAPGDEHGPRRLAHHGPREHAARRALAPRDDGRDVGPRPPEVGGARADRLGDRPRDPAGAARRRLAPHHERAGDHRHGGRGRSPCRRSSSSSAAASTRTAR